MQNNKVITCCYIENEFINESTHFKNKLKIFLN